VESRRLERIKRRFICEIVEGAERHEGIVMNLAPGGLFVLTKAMIPPGTQVEVQIPAAKGVPELCLRVVVVRQRLVPVPSSRLISQGLGLQVLQAPDAYFELAGQEGESPRPSGSLPPTDPGADRPEADPAPGSAPEPRSLHGFGGYIRRALGRGEAAARRGQKD
jgi:hypothetical protein